MKDMGYKAVYLAEEFHKELKKIMVCHKGERIVWLGVHPWLPLIIDFLFDEGCTDFSIVDNDKNKQGNVYFSYRCPNKSFRVEGADALEHIGKSLFIMANTHEIDFAKQLRDVGIQAEIHNLYNYTLKENTFINYGLDVAEKNGFRPITERDLQLKELEALKEFKAQTLKQLIRH